MRHQQRCMYFTYQVYFITSLADIQVGSSLTNDYEYVITDMTVLSQVIDNLNMDETYMSSLARGFR